MTSLVAAAGAGLVGSLHCAGMCGPLALAGCTRAQRIHLVDLGGYGLGRLIAYGTLGAVFGHGGQLLADAIALEILQVVALAAVALGALVKGASVLWGLRRPANLVPTSRLATAESGSGGLLAAIAPYIPRRGLALGLATGLLPCGLLAGAWALAAASGSAPSGAAVMAVFWAATVPGLAAPLIARAAMRRPVPPALVGIAWCGLGVWIGLRPLLIAVEACH